MNSSRIINAHAFPSGETTPVESTAYLAGDVVDAQVTGDIPFEWQRDDTNIVRLEIGSSTAEIGGNAFWQCTGLSGGLVIPDTVTSIGSNCFFRCSGFDGDLVISESLDTIFNSVFRECGFTGTLTIPEAVTLIRTGAFRDSTGFDRIEIAGLTAPTIQGTAFSGMSGVSDNSIHVSVGATGYASSYDGLTVVYDL